MIYIIINKNTNHLKIGYSNNPEKRLKTLQTSSAFKLELISKFNGVISLEKYIHSYFKASNVSGEWFDMSDTKIIVFMRFCVGGFTPEVWFKLYPKSSFDNYMKHIMKIEYDEEIIQTENIGFNIIEKYNNKYKIPRTKNVIPFLIEQNYHISINKTINSYKFWVFNGEKYFEIGEYFFDNDLFLDDNLKTIDYLFDVDINNLTYYNIDELIEKYITNE